MSAATEPVKSPDCSVRRPQQRLSGERAGIPKFSNFYIPARLQAKRSLLETDSGRARVIDDVVELLIAKNALTFIELLEALQRKLRSRKQLREDVGMQANLIGKDDTIF